MLFNELMTNKLGEILGAKYKVYLNDAFNKQFTNPSYQGFDVNFQAFEELGDKIIAVFSSTPLQLVNSENKFYSLSYDLQLWTPLDVFQISKSGTLVKGFDFYADIERIISAVTSGVLTLEDSTDNDGDEGEVSEITSYSVYMTMSEPMLANSMIDETGAYKRVVYRVNGTISADSGGVARGDSIEVLLGVPKDDNSDTELVSLGEVADVVITAETHSNLIMVADTLYHSQEPTGADFSVSFTVLDKTNQNKALKLIEKRVFYNSINLNPTKTGRGQYRVPVQIKKGGVVTMGFEGIVSATYTAAGKIAFGQYAVTIVNAYQKALIDPPEPEGDNGGDNGGDDGGGTPVPPIWEV